MRTLILVLALAGCGSNEAATPKRGCDLAGTYRLRFDARVGQWLWFRFELDKGMKAKQLPPIAIKATELTIDPDPAACKLAVIAKTERGGELLASLTVDKKTNQVTGTLRGVGMREGISIHGVRDTGPPTSPNPCVVPGLYQLVIPSEQEWRSLESGRSCDTAIVKVPFLVEYLGDKLVLDQLDPDGGAAWAAEDVYVHPSDPCHVDVRFRHDDWYTYSKIMFGGDKVTAEATSASVEVSVDGDVWRCEIQKPMSWVEKLR